jgi:trehalose 6-phosphate phosphatase
VNRGAAGTLKHVAMTVPMGLLAPFGVDPRSAGVFCDFDGTLADIVLDPQRARPVDGAVEVIGRLAEVVGRVGILSGRPIDFLEPLFPPQVFLAGLYGLEVREDGQRRDHPQAGAWREVVDDVVAGSRSNGPEGMRTEHKGLSLTFHYRGAPELAEAVESWAAAQAARSGLAQRPARMSVELHPPIDADKGTALLEAAEALTAVCYVGDDLGDVPAYDALDRLSGKDVDVLRAVVRSDEMAPGLLERADLVLDAPAQVVSLFTQLGTVAGLPSTGA